MDINLYPDRFNEKSRYEEHNNDVNDVKYQNFVSPITNAVLKNFKKEHKGLDFGAGTGPVISKVLKYKGYSILLYDPYFHPFPELLSKTYDYIVCCEVIEHFFDPAKEFKMLNRMLNPAGALFCMTDIYDDNINFSTWYYRNDPTHVFIYRKETFLWIKENFNFSKIIIDKRLIQLVARTSNLVPREF